MKRIDHNTKTKKGMRTALQFSGIALSLVLCIIVIVLYMQRNATQEKTVQILVAKEDISAQTAVSTANLSAFTVPARAVPPNAITSEKAEQILGKKLVISVQKGDILSPSYFGASKDTLQAGIANLIPQERKILYITQNDVHIFPPQLQKDNYVQIIAVNTDTEGVSTPQTVLSRVQVVDIIRTEEGIGMIGLLLTDDEVTSISSRLNGNWKLQIVMRPQIEATISDTVENTDRGASVSATVTPRNSRQ